MGETVKNIEEIANLTDNKIIGTPELLIQLLLLMDLIMFYIVIMELNYIIL